MNNNLLLVAANKGRTKWLQKLLSQRLLELNLPDADYHDWFDSLIQFMEDRGLVEPTQQKDYLSDVRNAIKVLDPDHPALEVVDFDKSTWTEINNRNSDRIAQRSTKFLDNPDAIVKRATLLLGSYQWSEIAAGLAVVTGRRCTEIIKTASFEYQSKYSVVFSGSLKRKNEPVECIFEIPTLCEANLVIRAIASLKDKLGGEIERLSKRQVSSRFGNTVAKRCDRYFTELVPPREDKDNLYTHLFRAVYATIAAYWYCPSTIPEMEFRAAIQGHYQILDEKNPDLRRSLAASRNYFDYKISDGRGNIDGRLGIKLHLPDVAVIEQFQHAYIPPPPKSHKVSLSNSNDNHKAIASASKPSGKQKLKGDRQPVSTASRKSKTSPSQPKSTMTNANSSSSTSLAIPAFLRSRLEAISNQLSISPDEAIQELFTWTEVGLALTEELALDEFNPNAVFNSVKSLKQRHSASSPAGASNSVNPHAVEELIEAKRQISSLTKSVERLTDSLIWHQANSSSLSPQSQPTQVSSSANRKADKEAQINSDRSQNNNSSTVDRIKNTGQPQDNSESKTKRRRDNSETVEQDIHHAIDAIIEFNDAPQRPPTSKNSTLALVRFESYLVVVMSLLEGFLKKELKKSNNI